MAYGDINATSFGQYCFYPNHSAAKVLSVTVTHSAETPEALKRFLTALAYDPADEPFYSHWAIAERFWSGQKAEIFDNEAFHKALVAARSA